MAFAAQLLPMKSSYLTGKSNHWKIRNHTNRIMSISMKLTLVISEETKIAGSAQILQLVMLFKTLLEAPLKAPTLSTKT